jgi:hypothetical protein
MADETIRRVTLPKRVSYTADADLDEFLERASVAVEKLAGVEIEIPGPTPSSAGSGSDEEKFLVPHNLGVRPDAVAMVDNGDNGGIVYANQDDKTEWTDTTVTVRCTMPNETNLTIRLTRRPE